MNTTITVSTAINSNPKKVWDLWTLPEHIIKWNNASPDWHTPRAENDLRKGGKFTYRMEARDGSFGFDYWGVYDEVVIFDHIYFTLGDERKVMVTFSGDGTRTIVTEVFEAESKNAPEMQKAGWQAILDNFRHYAETIKK